MIDACEQNKEAALALLECAAALQSNNALFQLGLFFDAELQDAARATECFRAVNPNAVALVNWALGMQHQVRVQYVCGVCLKSCWRFSIPTSSLLPEFVRRCFCCSGCVFPPEISDKLTPRESYRNLPCYRPHLPQVDAEKAESRRAKHAANRKAFAYFERGADMGDPDCIVNLAYHYLHGLGVEKDPMRALRYEEEAAQAGHAMVCSPSSMPLTTASCGCLLNVLFAVRWVLAIISQL
jgi:TPR repeat protein